jgi:hypothetical protein
MLQVVDVLADAVAVTVDPNFKLKMYFDSGYFLKNVVSFYRDIMLLKYNPWPYNH